MTDDFLDNFQLQSPQPRSRWETVAVVAAIVVALAAVFSAVTQNQSHPLSADIFLGVVVFAVVFAVVVLCYRPVVTWNRRRILRDVRNRVAREAWPKLLRFEKRFEEFLSTNDSRNLRYIINEIGGLSDPELFKLCPPDYLNAFYPSLSSRHRAMKPVREQQFRVAADDFITMVFQYNEEYVLKPLARLKDSPRFTQLPPDARKYRMAAIEAFRERWVKFLGDLTEFVGEVNGDFGYEPYHEAIHANFEHPKTLAL